MELCFALSKSEESDHTSHHKGHAVSILSIGDVESRALHFTSHVRDGKYIC